MKKQIVERLLNDGHINQNEYDILLDLSEDKSIWELWTDHILTNLK